MMYVYVGFLFFCFFAENRVGVLQTGIWSSRQSKPLKIYIHERGCGCNVTMWLCAEVATPVRRWTDVDVPGKGDPCHWLEGCGSHSVEMLAVSGKRDLRARCFWNSPKTSTENVR